MQMLLVLTELHILGVSAHPDGPRSLVAFNLISLDDYTEKLMMTMTKGEDEIGFELQSIDNMYFLSSSSTKP